MIVIRPTGDLAKRMKIKLTPTDEQSSTLLGDWYALDLVLDRQQYILCLSENGRLPLVLKAAPYANFTERLPSALIDLLVGIGVSHEKAQEEIKKMSNVILAKTVNRSVLGSMNECRFSLQAHAQTGRLLHDPLRMSLWLADLISLVLPDYTPKDTVLKLFGEPPSPRPRRPQLTLIPSPE
ncbi:MAG: hypothetical protein ABTQ25_01700 [Nitrosomonas ureae]